MEKNFFHSKTPCRHNSEYLCFSCVVSLNCDSNSSELYSVHEFYVPSNKKRKSLEIFKVNRAEEEKIFTILMNSKRAADCRQDRPAFRFSTRFVRKIEGYEKKQFLNILLSILFLKIKI